jgi:hypothetical protein
MNLSSTTRIRTSSRTAWRRRRRGQDANEGKAEAGRRHFEDENSSGRGLTCDAPAGESLKIDFVITQVKAVPLVRYAHTQRHFNETGRNSGKRI